MDRPTTIERAYELARSGTCTSVEDIRRQLKRENHDAVDGHLHGTAISRDLRNLCRAREAGQAG